MITNVTAYSVKNDAIEAFDDVKAQIDEKGKPILIIFCSPEKDFDYFSEEFHRCYPYATVVGSASYYVYSDKGYAEEALAAQAIYDGIEVSSGIIFEISHYPLRYASSIEYALTRFEDYENMVCLSFTSSMGNSEELVQDTFRSVLQKKFIPVVGGTAGGKDVTQKASVSINGRVLNDATVFVMIKSLKGKILVYKENIFKPTKHLIRATDVDCEERRVYEFEGYPAADVLSMLLHVPIDKLDEVLLTHPMGRISGDDVYITAFKCVNEDKSISYYARIYNQTRLAILEPDDLDKVWEDTARRVKEEIPNPSMTFTVNCVARAFFFDVLKRNDDFCNSLTKNFNHHVGMTGLGEQFNYEHFNQTMVMVVFE